MRIIAIGENIVVEVMKKEDKTEGGIIIPDTADPESFLRGKVISVGKDVTDVEKNDIIAFSKHGGQSMLSERKIYQVLKYGEVYCILEKDIVPEKTKVIKIK